MYNMASLFLHRCLNTIENILKSPLSHYPNYPNKLQVSALIYYFKCFPGVPTPPVTWSFKKRSIVPLKNKFQKFFYLLWLFLFDFLVGVVSPCYLIWIEFNSKTNKNTPKMGMKTSTFQILFAVGTFSSVCYSVFAWAIPANDICLDYKIVANFANYLHYVVERENPYRKQKGKVNVMGIMTHVNNQGFINATYLGPIVCLYFRMDQMWYILAGAFPSCLLDNGEVRNDNFCYALFYGIRPALIFAWMNNAGRIMGGSILFAWIFFEMFNECADMINGLKPEQGMHLYWAYWKSYIGVKYWFRAGLAIGIYGGIWLTTVCLYATLIVIPNANPFTLVYLTFPFCGGVAVLAFMCLPYVLQFPIVSRELINKWRYAAGIELGVHLDSNLSYMYHYDHVKLKTSIALGRMYSLRRYFSLNVVKVFISCYVNSISDYCISIWCVQSDIMIELIQSKINNFIITYFYPVLALRASRGRISKNKFNVSALLLKLNILTIGERRKLSLLRFVSKEIKLNLFNNWFVRSLGADNDYNIVRLSLPKFLSEKYKNSVKYSAIITWNLFVQLIKPPAKISSNMFIDSCKTLLLSKRDLT